MDLQLFLASIKLLLIFMPNSFHRFAGVIFALQRDSNVQPLKSLINNQVIGLINKLVFIYELSGCGFRPVAVI